MIPKVTIVMPVRNGDRWIREAIASVLSQTLSDLELFVVDDGSTDTTPQIFGGSRAPR
jgi:glycosyltransferase involved in cell wall biosynthesis